MSIARERILASVRRSLRRAGPLPESVRDVLDRRLDAPAPNLKPALGDDPVSLFVRKADAVHTRISRVSALAEVSGVVLRHVEEHGLGESIVAAPGLEGVQWSNRLAVERRAARGSDRISVTGAFAGIAETGSVMLLSGPESPTTLNFLPEDHVVVLRESRIVAASRRRLGHAPRRTRLDAAHREPHLRPVEDRRRRARDPRRRARPTAAPRHRRAGVSGPPPGDHVREVWWSAWRVGRCHNRPMR